MTTPRKRSWRPEERPFCNPSFWEERLKEAITDGQANDAIYKTDSESWRSFETFHRKVLHEQIRPNDSILDIACGWGRLLDLLPLSWHGSYYGMDLAPCFIERAKLLHPSRIFHIFDLRSLPPRRPFDSPPFEWGIGISIQRGLVGHLGQEEWNKIESNLLVHCNRLLFLDFDTETVIVKGRGC